MCKFILALAFIGAALPVAPGRGTDCSGDSGFVLTLPSEVPIGTDFQICAEAPAGWSAFLFVSLGQGPTDTDFGTFCLDFPPVILFPFVLPDDGKACFDHHMECDKGLVGLTGYLQFLAVNFATHRSGISNQESLTVLDGDCGRRPSFCSYTQGGWGQGCAGGNVGCLRDTHFAAVFPNGLVLGDQDGADGDGRFALELTTAAAIESFLPAGGPPGTFDQDLVDQTASSAGVLAGQLAAAKLNVGFDDAGVFDAHKSDSSSHLGDLVFVGCVDADLIGMSVRDLIDLADRAISGEFGACTDGHGCQDQDRMDVSGDGQPDVSLSDLSHALTAVNENFDECSTNHGCLGP